jgi:hypothetical protein
MTDLQIRDAAVLLIPGFLALKLFYLFGAQRPRSQWEWTTWSVLVSFPIDWSVRALGPNAAAWLHVEPATVDVVLRLVAAIGLAAAAVLVWGLIRASDVTWLVRLRRSVTDSAWDEVLDNAHRKKRWLEVQAVRSGGDTRYRGWLDTAGREDAQAEPWVYLRKVTRQAESGGAWTELAGTHGVLIHRDQIRSIRIFEQGASQGPPEAGAANP